MEFMVGCSYGNGLRLTNSELHNSVITEAARSLSIRFRPVAGVLQSWNVDGGWQSQKDWECPVIIGKMMNGLASPAYRANAGGNGNFILKYTVGSIPHDSEVDVP